jgi:2-amino-4-hydroxy-6-hydroxymethyldihydropteridine diphosphokinase
MKKRHSAYLSLGSNLGDKEANLKAAQKAIEKTVGEIHQVSPIYKTAAIGFEGNDFFNLCLEIKTFCSPHDLLEKILKIEADLGRQKKTTIGYQNRCIDIDILLMEEHFVLTERLTIPHPRAHLRNFVLYPLNDIAPNVYFPNFQRSVKELLAQCEDNNLISLISNEQSS